MVCDKEKKSVQTQKNHTLSPLFAASQSLSLLLNPMRWTFHVLPRGRSEAASKRHLIESDVKTLCDVTKWLSQCVANNYKSKSEFCLIVDFHITCALDWSNTEISLCYVSTQIKSYGTIEIRL